MDGQIDFLSWNKISNVMYEQKRHQYCYYCFLDRNDSNAKKFVLKYTHIRFDSLTIILCFDRLGTSLLVTIYTIHVIFWTFNVVVIICNDFNDVMWNIKFERFVFFKNLNNVNYSSQVFWKEFKGPVVRSSGDQVKEIRATQSWHGKITLNISR